jgi:hypothetical protein
LYVGVCDMMPEIGEMSAELEREYLEANEHKKLKEEPHAFAYKVKIQNLIIQNVGILIGYGCMFFLGLYSKYISL